MVVTPSDLLQLGNAILKSVVPNCRLQNGKVKINLGSGDNFNAPFDIMVPGKPVEVMKGLWMKEMGQTRQWPVHPKWFNNAIQAEDLDDLQKCFIVKGRTLFVRFANGIKSIGFDVQRM